MGLKSKAKYLLNQFPFIYPRKIINSAQEWIIRNGKQKGIYFSQRGPWYKPVFPAEFLHLQAPQTLGPPNEKAFYANRNYPSPKAGLFYFQNSFLFGHKGVVLTAKHEVFQEFTHHFNISSLKKFLRTNPFFTYTRNAKKINGVGAVLVSPESHNYYHWLSDVLPRIKLYEEVMDQIDHFCVASNVPAKFIDVLTDFGIAPEKVLRINDKEKLHFDHLYVSSLPGSEGRSPLWAINYIREKLVKHQGALKPVKKIYFKRGDLAERKILNEGAIVVSLQNKGFEIIEPGELSIYGQINLMQQASVVISAHGAALSNLLFCPHDTAVVEIFSPDYFRTDCYYTLSAARKLNYWYIVGNKPEGAKWGDIIADETLLEKTIAQLN